LAVSGGSPPKTPKHDPMIDDPKRSTRNAHEDEPEPLRTPDASPEPVTMTKAVKP